MGTRNLTMVKSKYELKVAQYGQWDGYPSGNGQKILNFLKSVDLEQFKKKVELCRFISQAELDALEQEKYETLCKEQPQFSRDTGADILQMIMENEKDGFLLHDMSLFGFCDISCEWLYLIDLDHNKLTVRHNLIEPILATYELDALPEDMNALELAL